MKTHPLFTAVEDHLHKHDINFEDLGDGQTLRFGLTLNEVSWLIHMIVDPDLPALTVFGTSEVLVVRKHQEEMLRILSHVNGEAPFGCLHLAGDEMDQLTLRLNVPALPGTDVAAVADFGLSLCASALKQLSEPLARISREGGTVDEFQRMLRNSATASDAVCDSCRQGKTMPSRNIVELN